MLQEAGENEAQDDIDLTEAQYTENVTDIETSAGKEEDNERPKRSSKTPSRFNDMVLYCIFD